VGEAADVVIVGGGVAGSALADGLASAGRDVTVLESSTEYVDRVRGEAMIVDGLAGLPDEQDVMVSDGDLFLLMFHQGAGRARLYICAGRSGQRRFAGPGAIARFLAAWEPCCYPLSELVAAGRPAGPCAT